LGSGSERENGFDDDEFTAVDGVQKNGLVMDYGSDR
jgi:hypothetical protein